MARLEAVSVVLSVFDQAEQVRGTINSVVSQEGVEFELIIVDDGADAPTKSVLESYAADPRMTILTQPNRGLTQALISACAAAKYPLVARIDAGDRMLEGRLQVQSELLSAKPQVVLVTSWVNVVTEEGYRLYQYRPTSQQLEAGARATRPDQVVTPYHASVMFRLSAYRETGGYRPEFYFAQDCDLWSRLSAYGRFAVLDKPLTQGVFLPSGLSGRYRAQQQALKKLVAEANQQRQSSAADNDILDRAVSHRPSAPGLQKVPGDESAASFEALYFIAKCLSDNRSIHARKYWRRAISARPWSILSWAYLMISWSYSKDLTKPAAEE